MADILDMQNGITAHDDEQTALQQMRAALLSEQPPALLGPDGQTIPIPDSVKHVLQQTVEHLVRGEHVEVEFFPAELTPQQVAKLLHVSRQFVVKLIHEGALPVSGSRLRIRLSDVLAYQRQQAERTHTAIEEIAQLSQESGNYH